MKKQRVLVWALAGTVLLVAGVALAADQVRSQVQTQTQEQVYGSQMMTPQELAEHRAKMRAAKTVEEREQIRKENHERMQARAKERGVTLPDEPPMGGAGMGPGGGGMGPGGGGMGPGGGGMSPRGGRGR
ncbi:MAG: hypothetical protein WCT30_01420 [Desulfurivibrionaceae bacterium]|jgi:hypothetical protein